MVVERIKLLKAQPVQDTQLVLGKLLQTCNALFITCYCQFKVICYITILLSLNCKALQYCITFKLEAQMQYTNISYRALKCRLPSIQNHQHWKQQFLKGLAERTCWTCWTWIAMLKLKHLGCTTCFSVYIQKSICVETFCMSTPWWLLI